MSAQPLEAFMEPLGWDDAPVREPVTATPTPLPVEVLTEPVEDVEAELVERKPVKLSPRDRDLLWGLAEMGAVTYATAGPMVGATVRALQQRVGALRAAGYLTTRVTREGATVLVPSVKGMRAVGRTDAGVPKASQLDRLARAAVPVVECAAAVHLAPRAIRSRWSIEQAARSELFPSEDAAYQALGGIPTSGGGWLLPAGVIERTVGDLIIIDSFEHPADFVPVAQAFLAAYPAAMIVVACPEARARIVTAAIAPLVEAHGRARIGRRSY